MQNRFLQKNAKFFLTALLIYSIVFPVYGLGGLLQFSFMSPDLMINHHFTNGQVDQAMRWKHFFAWLPANLSGILACFLGVYLSYLAHTGLFFTTRFSRGLWYLGVCVFLSGVFDLLAAAIVPHILSALNTNGQEALRFQFSPEELGLALCGIGFMALGRMMAEATRLSEENKEFV